MLKRSPEQHRGFTLVETMTVVVILGILSALAVYGVRRYIYAAKSGEAREMILNIKAAEEAYRDETYQYLATTQNLSGTSDLYPHTCNGATLGTVRVAWEQSAGCEQAKVMRALGVTSSGPVLFGYAVGVPKLGDAMPALPLSTPFNWGDHSTPNGPAFVVLAMGDVDGNGIYSKFVSSNFTDEIHVEAEGE